MERDRYFDSLKFVLIFFVILGHCLEIIPHKTNFEYAVYLFLYSFHMPLFAFITGYFSKNQNLTKINRSALKLVETYVVCQLLWTLFHLIVYKAKFEIESLYTPHLTLWYLISAVSWKYIAFIIRNLKTPILIVIFSALVALGIGFVPWIERPLSLSRTFVFLPFFLAGLYINKTYIQEIRSYKPIYSIIFLTAIAIILYNSQELFEVWNITTHAAVSYHSFDNLTTGFISRILMLATAFFMCFSIINLIPTINLFAKYGSLTLVFYIYHSFITYEVLPPILKRISIEPSFGLLAVIAVLQTIFICYLGRYKITLKLLNPLTPYF